MASSSPSISTRKPYTGSCHCGHTRYIIYLTLPPPLVHAKPPSSSSTIRIRKCNCSTCHKMSFFHLRLQNSPDDFLLLHPLTPEIELSDYTCFEADIHWYFCGKCGVRCFAFNGQSEVREVEVDWDSKGKEKEGDKVNVWSAKREGWEEAKTGYLSVNAATLDHDQEGLDLREWHEKGWIAYLDTKDGSGETRLSEPHEGGMY